MTSALLEASNTWRDPMWDRGGERAAVLKPSNLEVALLISHRGCCVLLASFAISDSNCPLSPSSKGHLANSLTSRQGAASVRAFIVVLSPCTLVV